jgi:HAD superfamily hydrolase (TIGR01484 family)
MISYKLLALDLDGTLLTPCDCITDESKEWIRRAQDAGVTVMFTTGRGMPNAGKFWSELQLDSPMVFCNGAEIWSRPEHIRSRHYIQPDVRSRIIQLAMETRSFFRVFSPDLMTDSPEWTEAQFERDWLKLVIRNSDIGIIDKLWETFESWGSLEVTQAGLGHMEITGKGISKESGLREVVQMMGIEMNKVMAIGDNLNDLHLIRSAGMGIAMGNADERLKLAADAITETNERNGVARAIQTYLLNGNK